MAGSHPQLCPTAGETRGKSIFVQPLWFPELMESCLTWIRDLSYSPHSSHQRLWTSLNCRHVFSHICQMWCSGLWQVFQASESNTVEEKTASLNIKAKAAKHTKGETLQPANIQFTKPENESEPPHYVFFFFIWSWNEGKVFEKYYFKISLSRKKIWLNHLCLAILFRAYIHSFKLDARLPEIWQIGSNHREWRFKRPLEPEMKPKLNTQLDKYSMFHMLREHQITSPLWAV